MAYRWRSADYAQRLRTWAVLAVSSKIVYGPVETVNFLKIS
jgi:hypothetical protein